MRVLLIPVVVASGLASPAVAAPLRTYEWTDASRIGARWEGPAAATFSNVIYLNNCSTGCTLSPGTNDAPTNRSSIVPQPVSIAPYVGTATQWDRLVQCVRQTYAPFDVKIVTTRPPAGTSYHMAIVAGHGQDVGWNGALGVSPFSCGYIPNAITFTFANEAPDDIDSLCWTVAQETAHSWGLDHKYDDRDPMTYLETGPSLKRFQTQAGSCGEYQARACQCDYEGTGSAQMNTYALIQATFGLSGPDTMLPTVAISSPAKDARVQLGFTVTATVDDNIGVIKAELRVDDLLVGTLTAAPWTWTTGSSLAAGKHRVSVTAYDAANNTASSAVEVNLPADLGTPCTNGGDCASGQCASGDGDQFCVQACDATGVACPSGFECIPAGGGSVCWPESSDGDDSGCNTGGGSGTAMLLLGLGFAIVAGRRRR